MYTRHQNGPGNGYRSNPRGMVGPAAGAQMYPEPSMRGHRMSNSNSEYRNYNRGSYGRGGSGNLRQFQPPQPPPHENDIFMEAGRLAAEYLVAKGILPPHVLPENQMGNFRGLRPHEREHMQIPMSANSCFAEEAGPGRRRYSDEFDPVAASQYPVRGRRGTVSFRNNGPDWNAGFGGRGLGSGSDQKRGSDVSAESDASARHREEKSVEKAGDSGVPTSSPDEVVRESDNVGDVESGSEQRDSNAGVVESSSCNVKDLPSDVGRELVQESEDANAFSAESGQGTERSNDQDIAQKDVKNMDVEASAQEDSLVTENTIDLTKHCNQNPIIEDDKINEGDISEPNNDLADHALLQPNRESESLETDVPKASASAEEFVVAWPGRSRSFTEGSLLTEQEVEVGLPGCKRSNSMIVGRGEKRTLDDDFDCREGIKRLKEWELQSDSYLPFSNLMENQHSSQEPRSSSSGHENMSPDQKSLDISLFPKVPADLCGFTEEKQLFPASFKTCDLNLMETCDVNENHNADPLRLFSSSHASEKQTDVIDVDFPNPNIANINVQDGAGNKDIEVIDLDFDSEHEEKIFTNLQTRAETVLAETEGFPGNAHNPNEITDAQDGYGLMISELLGNDIPNCTSIPTDLNSLHNDMSLHTGEGILGDDDSIYMSLGEIGFLRDWEQPTQDYGKPF